MKKIIVSIIIITLLLSTGALQTGRTESPINEFNGIYDKTLDCIIYENESTPKGVNANYQQIKSANCYNNKIYIIVNSNIKTDINNALNLYKEDLEKEGYTVEIHTVTTENPENIRSLLQNGSENLAGALLVGDIPAAWANLSEEYYDYPFICDMYYMDLDGTWIDLDGDNIPDEYIGDYDPEIWIGRLKADVLTYGDKDEIELLQNYFCKDHEYHIRGSPFSDKKALLYYGTYGGSSKIGQLYDEVTTVYNENSSADDYKEKLVENYEWIELHCHSHPIYHYFQRNGEWEKSVTSKHIQQIDPHACFHNLIACHVCKYTVENYIAGWYIFADTYGLVAIGETNEAGGANLEQFYNRLADGKNIGDAVKEYLTYWLEGVPRWGMTIIGDPTLAPLYQPDPPSSNPPDPPTINGETNGNPGTEYSYTFSAIDSDGDDVYYWIDWGDNTNKGWIGPYNSGEEITFNHTWNCQGTYEIKAKAKDINCAEGDWGYLEVTLPVNVNYKNSQQQNIQGQQSNNI